MGIQVSHPDTPHVVIVIDAQFRQVGLFICPGLGTVKMHYPCFIPAFLSIGGAVPAVIQPRYALAKKIIHQRLIKVADTRFIFPAKSHEVPYEVALAQPLKIEQRHTAGMCPDGKGMGTVYRSPLYS